VYEQEVEILTAEEGAAYGGALLAGVGAKLWGSVEEACDAVVSVQTQVRPEARSAEAIKKQYENYRQLYPALKQIFARMS